MSRSNQTEGKTLRLDLTTVTGLVLALASIAGGLLLEGGKLADVAQITAALIVFGGTLGAVLVTTPRHCFFGAVRDLRLLFFTTPAPFAETLNLIVTCAERARRNGIADLETEAERTPDAFNRKALNLAADGTDLREIRDMLLLDLQAEEDRAEDHARVWESAAGYAPTIGIIGAVLGLIQVMKHLENLSEVGRGIAVAFVATVYGVASANLFFLPAAAKLKARSREVARLREMTMEGVAAIVSGLNPKMIRVKLEAFLAPARERVEPASPRPRGAVAQAAVSI